MHATENYITDESIRPEMLSLSTKLVHASSFVSFSHEELHSKLAMMQLKRPQAAVHPIEVYMHSRAQSSTLLGANREMESPSHR